MPPHTKNWYRKLPLCARTSPVFSTATLYSYGWSASNVPCCGSTRWKRACPHAGLCRRNPAGAPVQGVAHHECDGGMDGSCDPAMHPIRPDGQGARLCLQTVAQDAALHIGRKIPNRQQRSRALTAFLGAGTQELPVQQERPGSGGERRFLLSARKL